MEKYFLDFSPPINGMHGIFNTFRLGAAWIKRVEPGDNVLLANKARSLVIGRAVVSEVDSGTLKEMAIKHGYQNHSQEGYAPEEAAQRITQSMIKRYGPHKCSEESKVTVLYLEIIEHAPE